MSVRARGPGIRTRMRAILALEDGTIFEGESLGATGRTYGEVVFNTGMTGYQEILTDPSYAGQIVALTYPLIGNYGINLDDFESRGVQVEGFIVREAAEIPSNWRSQQSLQAFLKERNIVGIKGVDTRALTRALRVRGVMMGAISTDETPEEIMARIKAAPPYSSIDLNQVVTTEAPYFWPAYGDRPISFGTDNAPVSDLPINAVGNGGVQRAQQAAPLQSAPSAFRERGQELHRVALLDCGVKYNILRSLAKLGIATTVYPCTATAADLLQDNPDGIMLSPG